MEHAQDLEKEAYLKNRLKVIEASLPAITESAQLQEYLDLYAKW